MQKRIRCMILVALVVIVAAPSYGQPSFKKLKALQISGVENISIDRLGEFYLHLPHGVIRKYDTEGNFMVEYRSTNKTETTELEPWNPLRIFLYERSQQEILVLDRFLEQQDVIPVDPVWAIEPVLASPGLTNNLWVLDKADLSLKLVDPKTKGVVREAVLKIPGTELHQFTYLREYQNLIFVVDKNTGLYVFNTLGVVVQQFRIKDLNNIGFLGEEVYYLEGHTLKFFDLYTAEVREVAVDPGAKFVLVTDERMIVVKENTTEILEFHL